MKKLLLFLLLGTLTQSSVQAFVFDDEDTTEDMDYPNYEHSESGEEY